MLHFNELKPLVIHKILMSNFTLCLELVFKCGSLYHFRKLYYGCYYVRVILALCFTNFPKVPILNKLFGAQEASCYLSCLVHVKSGTFLLVLIFVVTTTYQLLEAPSEKVCPFLLSINPSQTSQFVELMGYALSTHFSPLQKNSWLSGNFFIGNHIQSNNLDIHFGCEQIRV